MARRNGPSATRRFFAAVLPAPEEEGAADGRERSGRRAADGLGIRRDLSGPCGLLPQDPLADHHRHPADERMPPAAKDAHWTPFVWARLPETFALETCRKPPLGG